MVETQDFASLSSPSGGQVPVQVGRYHLLEKLGAGGMGTVYKAQDLQLNRIVAIKLPRFEGPPQAVAARRSRFQREARAAAQVWHLHVCPIYDVGEHEGHPYVVMAYVEGQSLANRLSKRGRYEDVGEAVALICQVLDALEAVHAHRIIHRDIKPANILIDTKGRAVLTDFGLARQEDNEARLTSDGDVVGTPAYMAPEQAAGQPDRIGPWTDIYSVGVVFFEMLTGRLPFEGPPLAVLDKILHEPPPSLASFRPYLDPKLESLLLKVLSKEPEGRFPAARQFTAALEELAVTSSSTALLQARPSREESRQPERLLIGTRPTDYGRYIQKGVMYVLPPFLLTLAGACLLIGLLMDNGSAYTAMGWLVVVGCSPVLFSIVRRWLQQQTVTSINKVGETWLMSAAKEGHVSLVRVQLAQGAEVNEKDKSGRTALMKAAGNGHIAVVRLLLAGGAEVNERDNEGQTALIMAQTRRHSDIVRLLESAGIQR